MPREPSMFYICCLYGPAKVAVIVGSFVETVSFESCIVWRMASGRRFVDLERAVHVVEGACLDDFFVHAFAT